jgi:hypothetical protein
LHAWKDPLTGRELRFRKTSKTEVEALIELCALPTGVYKNMRLGVMLAVPVPNQRRPTVCDQRS